MGRSQAPVMGGLNPRGGPGAMRRLDTGLLLRAYAAGLFPMADTREDEDVFWVEPRRRGILPLDRFHLPRSLAKVLKQERFLHSHDRAFGRVIALCAAEARGREESWINPTIIDAYCRLHAQGHAHSIETWNRDGELVGGLYGIRIGAAFFGESMFSRETDASKAALAHLVACLRAGGFLLLDTQFLTAHLARFGGTEVRRSVYLGLLGEAIRAPADWGRLDRLCAQSASGCAAGIVSPTGAEAGAGAANGVAARFAGASAGAAAGAAALTGADAGARAEDLAGGPSGRFIVQLLSQTS